MVSKRESKRIIDADRYCRLAMAKNLTRLDYRIALYIYGKEGSKGFEASPDDFAKLFKAKLANVEESIKRLIDGSFIFMRECSD